MKKIIQMLVFLNFIFCISLSSLAQTKVVVVPMFGDDPAAKLKGAWSVLETNQRGDIVQEGGGSFIAITNHLPDLQNISNDEDTWALVVASGANGINGHNGIQGPQGLQGIQGIELAWLHHIPQVVAPVKSVRLSRKEGVG